MVVMDDPDERLAMERALGRAGYSVVYAMDAQHALRDLESLSPVPASFMLDAGIPRPALTSLVQAIASTPTFDRVPILFIKQDAGSKPLH
jgi:PleD family two-component response regulator